MDGPKFYKSPSFEQGYAVVWAFLVAQLVKSLPEMQETWAQSLGCEDLLENMATHSSVLAWRIPMDRGAWRAAIHGVAGSNMTECLSTAQHIKLCNYHHNQDRIFHRPPTFPS